MVHNMNPSEDTKESVTTIPAKDPLFETQGMRVLVSLRRIIRAVDIHSRRLFSTFHVTVPQLLCLMVIVRDGPMNLKSLAASVSLGPSTVNGIVDRLESRGLVRRERSDTDRRHVFVRATPEALELTRLASPMLVQERLENALQQLPLAEQSAIAASLERIVELMGAGHLEASPVLDPREKIDNARNLKE